MIELKEIIKKLNLSKKNTVLIVLAILSLVCLLFSEFFSTPKNTDSVNISTGTSSYEYIKMQEERLEKIIKKIDGAGQTEVMITLESCYENVYLKDSTYKSESTKEDYTEETEEKYILNDESGIIIKVYEPTVKGVAVVCEGGGNIETVTAILETVQAVFNINSTNISVEKMRKEK